MMAWKKWWHSIYDDVACVIRLEKTYYGDLMSHVILKVFVEKVMDMPERGFMDLDCLVVHLTIWLLCPKDHWGKRYQSASGKFWNAHQNVVVVSISSSIDISLFLYWQSIKPWFLSSSRVVISMKKKRC